MMARRRESGGFTLVELLVVIVVLAVLAAIVLPKFIDSSRRSKEAALRSNLKLYRNAIARFYNDCGVYPLNLDNLVLTVAPPVGRDSDGNVKSIAAGDWHGPYLQATVKDPVSGAPFNYSWTSPTVGQITSSASGNGLDGTAYSSW
jgi:general secretion pathway protein G